MIKINLTPSARKDQSELERLLSHLNIKMLIIAIAVAIIPEMIIMEEMDSELSALRNQEETLLSQERSLKQEINNEKKAEEEIERLKLLEKKLKERISLVKQVIGRKQNHYPVLLYIAENIPKDIWLVEIVAKDSKLELYGFSESWKSIGKFIESLKKSIFLSKNINYTQPQELKSKFKSWDRKEAFKIELNIARFN